MQLGLLNGSGHGVFHQEGDCHRPYATRHRGDRRNLGQGAVEIDVTHQAAAAVFFNTVDADVDDHCTWLEPAGVDHPWTADGGDDDVGLTTQSLGVDTA